MTTALQFRETIGPQPSGAVRLVFGYLAPAPIIPPPATLRAWMSTPWQRAASISQWSATFWRAAGGLRASWLDAPWAGLARVAPSYVQAPWRDAGRLDAPLVGMGWISGASSAVQWSAPGHSGIPMQSHVAAPWRQALQAAGRVAAPWGGGRAAHHRLLAPWRSATPAAARVASPFGFSRPSATWLRAPWNDGNRLTSYGGPWTSPIVPPVPVVPCYVPAPGGAVPLQFRGPLPALTQLVFTCNHGPFTIRVPVRRVYMIINTTTLVRVDTGASIPCLGLSLSLDVDSWAWGWSASLPADALSLIEPDGAGEPVELAATVNGTQFRLIAESLARERTFGQAGIRVQGRGKTAVLDAPYAPLQVFGAAGALTSQQIVDQALPAGWTAAWGLTAWLVPGGVWSHVGTPITAALTVAAAGGGYVQPHPTADSISVLPRYPAAPWDWAGVTPDIELPSAVIVREGIEWAEKARYNRVYVSGVSTGVLGRVTRTGTAGDVVAQMITDALITHADAARQRGLPVLADTGRIATVTLRLPVLVETGVLRPGQFLRYVDGAVTRVGLVRSVSVEAQLPEVWQTIKVETHVD